MVEPTELLNPTGEEAEPGDPGISGAEVAEVVKKVLGGRTPRLDDIRPEFLMALDAVGLSWFTRLCNFRGVAAGLADQGGGPSF